MAKRLYPAVLEHGAKDTYVVWLPDFPDCVAAGLTREDAIEKAEFLVAQAAEQMAERDHELPAPTALERIVVPKAPRFIAFLMVGVEPPDPSERVNIYLPKSLLTRADKRAAELGMSRSSFFGLAVSQMVGMRGLIGGGVKLGAPRATARISAKPKSSPKRSGPSDR